MKRLFLLTVLMSFPIIAEVNSWECGKFEGATIISHDGTFLGELGPDGNQIQYLMIHLNIQRHGHQSVFLIHPYPYRLK